MAEKKLYKDVVVAKGTLRTALPTQRAYRGISTVNNDNTKFGLFDIGLIKQDIINHFHISKGEKLENPNFGTIIWDVLQDPLTSELEEAIEQDVLDTILVHLPAKKLHPRFLDEKGNAIEFKTQSFGHFEDKELIDPRWAALKDLKK